MKNDTRYFGILGGSGLDRAEVRMRLSNAFPKLPFMATYGNTDPDHLDEMVVVMSNERHSVQGLDFETARLFAEETRLPTRLVITPGKPSPLCGIIQLPRKLALSA